MNEIKLSLYAYIKSTLYRVIIGWYDYLENGSIFYLIKMNKINTNLATALKNICTKSRDVESGDLAGQFTGAFQSIY